VTNLVVIIDKKELAIKRHVANLCKKWHF